MANRTAAGRPPDRTGPTIPTPAATPTATRSSGVHRSGTAGNVTVTGLVYGPHSGRRQNMILVRWCPHCEHTHRHLAELLARTYSRCCPVTGQPYTVAARVERDTRKAVRHAA